MVFSHKLPSMYCEGVKNGLYNNPELGYPSLLTTLSPRTGEFIKALRDAMHYEQRLILIDGKALFASHNWIRDCTYIMETANHFEYDLHSFYDFLVGLQTPKGFFLELIKQIDDEHWKTVDKECYKLFEDDNLSVVRLELEADIEYLMVIYARQVWQAEGDDGYIQKLLPALEKGIDYITSDEKRWDAAHGLVKRPYTIDTWDFTNDPASQNDRRIHPDNLSIMHGDNSGVYAAMKILARFRRRFGDAEKAESWENRAEKLRENMIRWLWNGRFFVHQLPLTAVAPDGLDNERLSLSNPYDINRGVTDLQQSRCIIDEYRRRRETTDAFAEWFSIDPPYPMFLTHPYGRYVNGAISPFCAGELALAAFENGCEDYGVDILTRFEDMWERDKTVSFLYDRRGGGICEGMGSSAWGASSLLKAIEEGLAGIRDLDCLYRVLGFSPRWAAGRYKDLRYITGYAVSHITVDVRYEETESGIKAQLKCPSEEIRAHILLPKGRECARLLIGGKSADFVKTTVGDSVYTDFTAFKSPSEALDIELIFA